MMLYTGGEPSVKCLFEDGVYGRGTQLKILIRRCCIRKGKPFFIAYLKMLYTEGEPGFKCLFEAVVYGRGTQFSNAYLKMFYTELEPRFECLFEDVVY